MKFFIQQIFILIVFFKTNTLFSENNLFNVNNIQLEKKEGLSNSNLANQAIKKGFTQLISRILLQDDFDQLSNLKFETIKELVTYYQIKKLSGETKEELVNFSITFDKDKIHQLFYQKGISYSEITDKELYILPIYIKDDEIFIFNNNFFYNNWNEVYQEGLLEFILPLENIEIIENINNNQNNLVNLEINSLFKEYSDKNLALILIEENKTSNKVYIKSKIQGKDIFTNMNFKKQNLEEKFFFKKVITETKKELINLVKSKNLIDIRTPSFLNVKFNLDRSNNLIELNLRIKKIDSIENVFVQNFDKNQVNLRIKYLGKLEKLINQLKKEKVKLQLINEDWVIKYL